MTIAELETQLEIANKIGYTALTKEQALELINDLRDLDAARVRIAELEHDLEVDKHVIATITAIRTPKEAE